MSSTRSSAAAYSPHARKVTLESGLTAGLRRVDHRQRFVSKASAADHDPAAVDGSLACVSSRLDRSRIRSSALTTSATAARIASSVANPAARSAFAVTR